MKNLRKYIVEYLLIFSVIALSVAGFWNIYFGVDASPTWYQTVHLITILIWLFLLLFQLSLIGRSEYDTHRKIGLSILIFGPLLFAATALLSVYSAHKGLISGKGDALLVQNVMGTFELGLVILLAFVFRKRRALHGAFLLSSAILFMGIALFFTLLGWAPQFKIEGPETFYRFGMAAGVAQLVVFPIGLLFFVKDWRNGWPYLLVSLTFTFNHFINVLLENNNLIPAVTEFVGTLNPLATFLGSFVILFILLTLTGIRPKRPLRKLGQ